MSTVCSYWSCRPGQVLHSLKQLSQSPYSGPFYGNWALISKLVLVWTPLGEAKVSHPRGSSWWCYKAGIGDCFKHLLGQLISTTFSSVELWDLNFFKCWSASEAGLTLPPPWPSFQPLPFCLLSHMAPSLFFLNKPSLCLPRACGAALWKAHPRCLEALHHPS